ncbi:MAG: hypothetical protein AABO41_24740 [Acidobacteriota bacterium]
MRTSGKRPNESGASSLASFRMKLCFAVCVILVVALGWSVARFSRTGKAATISRARLSETTSVHASGRGNPTINLSDGRDVLTSYSGPAALIRVLEQNLAQPLSLASADFDEDGVPDLICGYGHSGTGIVSMLGGNVDSIHPNSAEAQERKIKGEFTDSPFLSPARVFALPIKPDFTGAGDFDADGHWDVVAASRSSSALYLLPGDGKGNFGAVRQTFLPGTVSALVTGEINRRDGLEDVVVAIKGEAGAKALVFEGPEGALRAEPEVFDLPEKANALALGQLDDEYTIDLAVAAGRELIVVRGRDRQLSLSEVKRAKVPKAQLSRRAFPYNIRSVAAGQFADGNGTGLSMLLEGGRVELLSVMPGGITKTAELDSAGSSGAKQLITARVSSSARDDLVIMDSAARQIHILSTGKQTAGPRMNMSAALESEAEPVAMLTMRLNEDALTDLVVMKSGGSSPAVLITLAPAVFGVTENADGGLGSLRQAIIDANNSPGADTINFAIPASQEKVILLQSPLPEVTEAVTIDGTTQPGYAESPVVAIRRGGTGSTLKISGGNSTVRGLDICSLLSGRVVPLSDLEIVGVGGNRVEGNVFSAAGAVIRSSENIVGGTASGAGNRFAANLNLLTSLRLTGQGAFNNQIQGNSFTQRETCLVEPLFQCGTGIVIDAPNNVVGGATPQARNIISGPGLFNNVIVFSGAGNLVQGNFIGVDDTGARATGSFSGVNVRANNTTIGGTTPQARNVISGNFNDGISILGLEAEGDTGILIQGNFIGTDVTGTKALGNGVGVTLVLARGTIVGGDIPAARNIISGNRGKGVGIGLASSNACFGTSFPPGSRSETIGNFIGTDVSGTQPLGNGVDGVNVRADAFSHLIKGNLIAFNGGNGVSVSGGGSGVDPGAPALSIQILENSVFSNGGLAIDLGEDGVTPNDPRDPDEGANLRQNFPVLTSSTTDLSNTTIQGNFNSNPNQTFTIEFFSNPADESSGVQALAIGPCVPQGQIFIGSITVTTNASGNAPISIAVPAVNPGGFINATATSVTGNIGNTSEFSACVQSTLIHADLSVAVEGPSLVVPGGDLSYQVTVASSGPALATNVTLSAAVPANTTFQSLTAPAGWTSRLPDVGGTGSIICSTAGLLPGTSASFTIVVKVNPGTADGAIITAMALVSSGILDLNPGNNSSTATTIVSLTTPPVPPGVAADLAVDLTGSPASVFAGDGITYTLTVRNLGPAVAKDVVLRQAMPMNTSFQSSSEVSGWSRDGPAVGGTGTITYMNAGLGSGGSATFTIVVKVDSDTPVGTTLLSTASVSSAADPNSGNNFKTVTTSTRARPQGPSVQSITVGSKITVVGSGFVKKVQVFIDGVGFSDAAKRKGSTRVIQKGKLTNGKSISDAVPPGKLVMIKLLNGDGGEIEVSFRK